jgi:hypothetical protein
MKFAPLGEGAGGIDGRAEDTDLVGGGDDFEATALQRAHHDHFVEQAIEAADFEEIYLRAGNVKNARAFHVNTGGSSSCQSAVAQLNEFSAALVAGAGVDEHFLRFQIEEAESHGVKAEDAFQVTASATTTIVFTFVEGDHGVAAFPEAFDGGVAAEADAVAKGPDTDELVEFASRSGDSSGHGVRVIEETNGHTGRGATEGTGEFGLQIETFRLLKIGGLSDDTFADDAGEADADGGEFLAFGELLDVLADGKGDEIGGHGLEWIGGVGMAGRNDGGADNLVVFDETTGDVLHDEDAEICLHCDPAQREKYESKISQRLQPSLCRAVDAGTKAPSP